MTGSITEVTGILVGHHDRRDPDATVGDSSQEGTGWACGTTVVLTPPGTVGAVDVRGGAPGTRETELLDPANSVRHVDAVVLSGGSAFGLASADGVMRWLEEHGRGVQMTGGTVPIVPAAVIFDLPVGAWANRPDAQFGYAAAESAGADFAVGSVGGATGARWASCPRRPAGWATSSSWRRSPPSWPPSPVCTTPCAACNVADGARFAAGGRSA